MMSPKTNSALPVSGSGLAFRFYRALVAFALWLTVVGSAPLARAVTFTSNVTIAEGDTTYDGQDIIVDGATPTINGTHGYTSLSLINGAVLTHSPCTATETYKLEVNAAGDGHGECRQPDQRERERLRGETHDR